MDSKVTPELTKALADSAVSSRRLVSPAPGIYSACIPTERRSLPPSEPEPSEVGLLGLLLVLLGAIIGVVAWMAGLIP